jgi:hypothetical protein
MTLMFRGQARNRFGRGVKEQSHRAAAGARARRNGRWTGHRPLEDAVREARIRAIATHSEVLP